MNLTELFDQYAKIHTELSVKYEVLQTRYDDACAAERALRAEITTLHKVCAVYEVEIQKTTELRDAIAILRTENTKLRAQLATANKVVDDLINF